MGYSLTCNRIPRALLCLAELSDAERSEFDYVSEGDEYSPRFVRYRGTIYDAHDTQRIEPDNGRVHPMGWVARVRPGEPLAYFDSVQSETYFSGIAFRFVGDDHVIVGRFYS